MRANECKDVQLCVLVEWGQREREKTGKRDVESTNAVLLCGHLLLAWPTSISVPISIATRRWRGERTIEQFRHSTKRCCCIPVGEREKGALLAMAK